MTDKELEYAKKYKKISEVSENECYLGGNWCGTCMYCTDGNRYNNFIGFEHKYCTKAKIERKDKKGEEE